MFEKNELLVISKVSHASNQRAAKAWGRNDPSQPHCFIKISLSSRVQNKKLFTCMHIHEYIFYLYISYLYWLFIPILIFHLTISSCISWKCYTLTHHLLWTSTTTPTVKQWNSEEAPHHLRHLPPSAALSVLTSDLCILERLVQYQRDLHNPTFSLLYCLNSGLQSNFTCKLVTLSL